jgi:CRISPR-associated protein Csm3
VDRVSREIQLRGRVFLRGEVRAVTGLHVGGSAGALAIGNVDQPVVRNPLNNQPYLPGSSVRGKMRSLAEKFQGKAQNQRIGQNVFIHVCQLTSDYLNCDVCQVFGAPATIRGQGDYGGPTRLLVRDVALSTESVEQLRNVQTDMPFTEVKWEAAIDRVTSAATPRQQERVPAGAVFAPLELVYSVYEPADWADRFQLILQALQWVEDDYLGGQGSRGSGRVKFERLSLEIRSQANYATLIPWEGTASTPAELLARANELTGWLETQLPRG